MNTTFETLILEVDDSGICTLTINRPKQLNALNDQVFAELGVALDQIEQMDEIKSLIITGSGEKAFVAGADIKEFTSFTSDEATKLSLRGQAVFQRIENFTIPVIAAINGYALGGGLELAMACHMRIASSNAVMGLPEVSLGLIPGYGGTQRLPRLVGKAKALELIMTGRFMKAEEALQSGLIIDVAEEGVVDVAVKILSLASKQAPLAIKNAILAIKEAGADSGFESEAGLFGDLFGTADFKEGTAAFIEKRKPNFSGK